MDKLKYINPKVTTEVIPSPIILDIFSPGVNPPTKPGGDGDWEE